MMDNFVYIDQYELLGSNFYWHKRATYNISEAELFEVGLHGDRVLVHESIIQPLLAVDQKFQEQFGLRLYIKEGYRSAELYKLIYAKRVAKFGQEMTDKLLNITDMPHATGQSVDIALWNVVENKEVYLRNGADDPEALFADFYKNKTDQSSLDYQRLQEKMIIIMQDHGFRLGKLREYFHFNYRPEEPRNY
jgi:D-alanyl-D-alanine dipeptidase